MNHHNDDLSWQVDRLANMEAIACWQLWANGQKQRRTNDLLAQNNALQAQNNALLEQIRRNSLTPAQRAAEDQQRARLAALRAAEEQLETERQNKIIKWCVIAVSVVVLLAVIFSSMTTHARTEVFAPDAPAVSDATPTPSIAPEPSPTPQLVTNQQELESMGEKPAPRAELIKLPK
jgi:hypothetical protein